MTWVFVCGFALCLERRPRFAAIFLACAAAIKIYPILITALFLARRQKREAALTFVVCGILTLVSAALLPGGVARSLEMMRANMKVFVEQYALGDEGLRFSSSLWSALKLALPGLSPATIPQAYAIYTVVFGLLGVALWIYVARSRRPLWHQAALLCFAFLLFPPVSYDYKLIHLLFPILLFLNAPAAPSAHINRIQAVCFGLLLVPKPFPLFALEVNVGDWRSLAMKEISIAVLINPLLMLILCALMQWEWQLIRAQNASSPSSAA